MESGGMMGHNSCQYNSTLVEITCSTTLFTVGTYPMVFVLEETSGTQIVAQMIRHGGGSIGASRGPYGIYLSPHKNLLPNEAVFSTEFIEDCCMANKILDINKYRLSGPSSYPDNFNVMEVLLRQSHWPKPAERDGNDLTNTDKHSDSDTTMDSQNSRRGIGSHQRTFSSNEEKEILRYIVENKEIGLIQGNTLWKKIAQRKVQGRTWQSLKKHFQKHILPNITKYTFLSVSDRLEFQKQANRTADSCDVINSGGKLKFSSSVSPRLSLHKTAASGDAGSSSTVMNQRVVVEVHRSNTLSSRSGSPVSNDGSNVERLCDQRLPKKRKPFRIPRAHESSESVSGGCSENADDQTLQEMRHFNTSTSSQIHRHNKDDKHPRKQDELQYPEKNKACIMQRRHKVINSSDEVDSASEEHHRSPTAPTTNKDGGLQKVINSSAEVDSASEEPHRSPAAPTTNKEGRESQHNSSSDDWLAATDLNIKATQHKGKKPRKRRREEFTMEEEYAIVKYLQKHNRFSNTGGNNVWKNMAATEPVGNRHTWHSLRERYLKKIVPNINKYNLPEEIVRRIKSKGPQPLARKAGKTNLFA